MNKIITLTFLATLAACTQQQPEKSASAPAQTVASETAAPKTVSHPTASAPMANIQAASQTVWTPPAKANTPKEEAQQLRDVLTQLEKEAAERMVAQRQRNMQPNLAESTALIRNEAAAIRQAGERLQQLDLSDKEVQNVRDLWAKYMFIFAETADLQVQAAELGAQNKQAEAQAVNKKLGDLVNGIEAQQQEAESELNALLKKYKIAR